MPGRHGSRHRARRRARPETPDTAAHPRSRDRSASGSTIPAGLFAASAQCARCARRNCRCISGSGAPIEKYGRPSSDALGIAEHVRLVRALVDRPAAQLGEPDRLAPGTQAVGDADRTPPGRLWCALLPPAREILEPPHPRLAIRAIGDRRPRPRDAVGVRGIVPVVPLAARDAAARYAEIIRPVRNRRIRVLRPVAPVGERHVVVDPHRIDVVRRPQRIEVKELRSAARLQPRELRPVRRIGELRRRPDDRPHLRRQRHQRRDERKRRSPPSRRNVIPRISEPMINASTPPAATASPA